MRKTGLFSCFERKESGKKKHVDSRLKQMGSSADLLTSGGYAAAFTCENGKKNILRKKKIIEKREGKSREKWVFMCYN